MAGRRMNSAWAALGGATGAGGIGRGAGGMRIQPSSNEMQAAACVAGAAAGPVAWTRAAGSSVAASSSVAWKVKSVRMRL